MSGPAAFADRELGRTRLTVGPVGLSASYGIPAKAVEAAFERGMNYLYFGSRRTGAFAEAVRNLRGRRERMVAVVQSYTPVAWYLERSVEAALRKLGIEYADVLLLGMWNRVPPARIFEACERLRESGKVRHIGMSAHHRPVFQQVAAGPPAVFHARYNAVHRGCETEVFPYLAAAGAGVVTYTATCWRRLLDQKRVPKGEPTPQAADCYRFALSQAAVQVCMTGTANEEQTAHALTAVERGPMDEEELAWMRRVGDAIHAAGG
ncbi:MAG: aldo/keto reductase [Bryobacteraceae bacterium]